MNLGTQNIRFLSAGESHGPALVGILEGIPAGLKISSEEIQKEMQRRKRGYGRGSRQKIETDQVEVLSGLRFSESLGSPLALKIQNKDYQNWESIMPPLGKLAHSKNTKLPQELRPVYIPRPGHADLGGALKYKHKDMRNVLERSSARETAMRVALGSIARIFLKEMGVSVGSHVLQIGSQKTHSENLCKIQDWNPKADAQSVRCLCQKSNEIFAEEIRKSKLEGNTLGGIFEVGASGLIPGLGSYTQWDRRLEGKIAQSFLSLNAITGVEIGAGFQAAELKGSDFHDTYSWNNEKNSIHSTTNNEGGITGGMSTGADLIVRASMKPLATLMQALDSVDLIEKDSAKAHVERSDVCAVPSAAVVAESLLCLILMDEYLHLLGGDHMDIIKKRLRDYQESLL